jgi:6-pyruvoyl-tetrahydropterin synthase
MFSERANRHGMVVDFKGVKNLLDMYDHTFIFTAGNKAHIAVSKAMLKDNSKQVFIWLSDEPTAENIAQHMLAVLKMAYPDIEDISIRLCEGYKGEENTSWVVAHDE